MRLPDDLACRDRDGAAMRHHRARADGAFADERRAVRIARLQRDALRIDADDLGHHLGIHRLVALPRRAAERMDACLARGAEADIDFLLRGAAGARWLDEQRAADASQLAAL